MASLPELEAKSLKAAKSPDASRGVNGEEVFARHQDKLVYGSDCSDRDGVDEHCTGWITLGLVRRLNASKKIQRKLLYENARKMFRLNA